MARRAKGDGSLKERANGRWEGYLPYKDNLGRSRRKYFTGRTKREVQALINAFKQTLARGPYFEPARKPLETYLAEWLQTDAPKHVKPHVIPSYERYIKLYLNPLIGHLPLAELTTPIVQAWCDTLAETGRAILKGSKPAGGQSKAAPKPLAPSTISRAKGILQSALGDARRRGLILDNPADGAKGPTIRREEMKYWRPEQTRKFLASVEGHYLEAYYLVALALGLRISEALGLRWSDVDLEKGTLKVEQTLQRSKVDNPIIADVKRGSSRRTIRLPQKVIAALRKHRASQNSLQLAAGANWKNKQLDLIFTSETGYHLEDRNILHQFRRLAIQAKLPQLRVHDMRHTAAALMILTGANIKVVSETLGHASIRITLDLYGHLYDEQKQDVADAMDRLLS